MTPIKFVLRYTAIPFVAIVAVVLWAVVPSSKEIDARQYAALSRGYANFPLPLRHEISESMADGRISDGRYQALVRDSLGNASRWTGRHRASATSRPSGKNSPNC